MKCSAGVETYVGVPCPKCGALDGELCEGWKDTNHPAFPVENTNDIPEEWRGMTMRQYYKARAPVEQVSFNDIKALAEYAGMESPETDEELLAVSAAACAKFAGVWADAMLREDSEHEAKS